MAGLPVYGPGLRPSESGKKLVAPGTDVTYTIYLGMDRFVIPAEIQSSTPELVTKSTISRRLEKVESFVPKT